MLVCRDYPAPQRGAAAALYEVKSGVPATEFRGSHIKKRLMKTDSIVKLQLEKPNNKRLLHMSLVSLRSKEKDSRFC